MMKREVFLCVVFLLVSRSSSAPAVLWQTPCGEVFDARINITEVTYRMSSKFGQIRNSVEQFVKDLVGDTGLDLDSEPLLDIDLSVIARGALHYHWSCKLNAEVSCVVSSGLRQFAYLLKATKDRVAEENLYGAASIAKNLQGLVEENLSVLCDVESLMAVMNPIGNEIQHCTNALKFQSAHRFEVPSEWISSSEDHTLSLKRNIRIGNEYRKFTTHVREWLRHITTMSIDGKIRHTHCFKNMEPNEM